MDDELRQIIEDLGIQKTADMLGIHRTTVLRWTRYQTKPPANTKRFLSAAMGKLWGKWQGWVIDRDGDLYAPTNERFEPEDLYVRRWHLQLIKAQRKEIAELEEKVRRLSIPGPAAANDATVPNAVGLPAH